MINDPHSLLGIAHVEDEHVHKGGHVEGGEGGTRAASVNVSGFGGLQNWPGRRES